MNVQDSPATEHASRAARLLLDARKSGRRLHALPADLRPQTVGAAYAIQDLVLDEIGVLGGWKVGAKSMTAEPTCAPLPAALILRSPQRFPAGAFALNGVEAEIAVTLARDLPARREPYTEGDVFAAAATIHAAIEVVDSRFLDMAATDALSVLADFQSNGALVLNRGVALSASFAYKEQTVRLDFDGARIVEARDSNPAGSPFRLLAWLANHAVVRCGGLRRSQVVTTGSWTGMRFVAAGSRVTAEFPGIGGVDIGF